MIKRAKISAVRASGVRCLFEGGAYSRKYGMLKNLQVTEAKKKCSILKHLPLAPAAL